MPEKNILIFVVTEVGKSSTSSRLTGWGIIAWIIVLVAGPWISCQLSVWILTAFGHASAVAKWPNPTLFFPVLNMPWLLIFYLTVMFKVNFILGIFLFALTALMPYWWIVNYLEGGGLKSRVIREGGFAEPSTTVPVSVESTKLKRSRLNLTWNEENKLSAGYKYKKLPFRLRWVLLALVLIICSFAFL
jgi:hypothetical protein